MSPAFGPFRGVHWIWFLTEIHAPFPEVAARNVHMPFKVVRGYLSCVNSFSLCVALFIIAVSSLDSFSVIRTAQILIVRMIS